MSCINMFLQRSLWICLKFTIIAWVFQWWWIRCRQPCKISFGNVQLQRCHELNVYVSSEQLLEMSEIHNHCMYWFQNKEWALVFLYPFFRCVQGITLLFCQKYIDELLSLNIIESCFIFESCLLTYCKQFLRGSREGFWLLFLCLLF